MAKKTKITIIVVLAIAAVGGAYVANRYWIRPVVAGQVALGAHPAAPDFTLADIFGQELSLGQYRGKVVLLDFWATWCGPCRMEIPGFIGLQKRYGDEGFQAIGISEDPGGVAPVLSFYRQMGMNYRVAVDNGKVQELYGGIFGLPTTFLIGRDGRIYLKIPGAVDASGFEPGIKTLLAASPRTEVKNFQPLLGSEQAEVETRAEANSVVPGIDVSKLTKPELAKYESLLSQRQCTCGCNVNALICRKTDPGCDVSRQIARKTLAEIDK